MMAISLYLFNSISSKGLCFNLNKSYFTFNKIRSYGENNSIECKDNSKIKNCKITIKGNNNRLIFDQSSKITKNFIEIIGDNCVIQVGKNTKISQSYLSSKGNKTQLIIGDNCMLSRHVDILTCDGHPIYSLDTNERINPPKNIFIHDHVWVSASATILKGVTIDTNSVVGLGSVVTKNVEKNTIVAGNPARKVKENINWSE